MKREIVRTGQSQSASSLTTNSKVSLAQDNEDDDASAAQQLLNRLTTNYAVTPDWRWTKGTLIAIALLMALSFMTRLSVSDLIEPSFAEEPDSFAGLSMDGLEGLIPMDDGPSPLWHATGKLSTLLIFTMVFLGIQIIAIYISRTYGFAGQESRKAYEIVKKFRTREEYLNKQKALEIEISNAAQARLNALQERIVAALNESGVDADAFKAAQRSSDRTFLAYVHAQHHEEKTREYEDL
jgi:hypothetical protein